MKTLTRNQATEFIKSLHNKIFGCTFIKKNGEERTMSARLNVSKYTKGEGLNYDPEEHNLIPVFDCNKEDYRMINLSGLRSIKVNGEEYKIED